MSNNATSFKDEAMNDYYKLHYWWSLRRKQDGMHISKGKKTNKINRNINAHVQETTLT